MPINEACFKLSLRPLFHTPDHVAVQSGQEFEVEFLQRKLLLAGAGLIE